MGLAGDPCLRQWSPKGNHGPGIPDTSQPTMENKTRQRPHTLGSWPSTPGQRELQEVRLWGGQDALGSSPRQQGQAFQWPERSGRSEDLGPRRSRTENAQAQNTVGRFLDSGGERSLDSSKNNTSNTMCNKIWERN